MLLFILSLFFFSASLKNVNIELKGTWKRTHFSVEASEFFSSLGYLSFWTLLENPITFTSEKNEFEKLKGFLREEDHKTFEYALSINYYSPLVSTFQRLGESVISEFPKYSAATSFVHCEGGHLFLEKSELEKNMETIKKDENNSIQKFRFDHIYSGHFNDDYITCVLYGDISDKKVTELHTYLSTQKQVNYLFRHFYQMDVKRKDHFTSENHDKLISLQGYGIELQIKDLEYRTMDPKARPKAQAPSEFAGIKFDTLLQKYPDDDYKLNVFRNALVKENKEVSSPKKWEIQNIGVQASQRILSSPNQLDELLHVSQNFPSLLHNITKFRYEEELKKEILQNHKYIPEGESNIFLNGASLDLETTSIFSLFDKIKSQSSFFKKLHNINLLSNKDRKSVVRLINEPEIAVRFDLFPKELILWINDVERDDMYNMLPKNLGAMKQLNYWGRRQFAKRNIFNLISVIDPLTSDGIETISNIFNLLQNRIPYRMGFVLLPTGGNENNENIVNVNVDLMGSPVSVDERNESVYGKLMSLLECIREHGSDKKVLEFILTFGDTLKNGEMTVEALDDLFHAFRHSKSIANKCSEVKESHLYTRELNTFLKNKPLLPELPFMLLNGRLFHEKNPQVVLQSSFTDEHDEMKKLIIKKVLTDKSSTLLEDIYDEFNAFPEYSTEVFGSVSYVEVNFKDVEVNFFKKNKKNCSKV